MKSKLLNDGAEKTFAVVFDQGDDVIAGLTEFAQGNGVEAAQITAIGGFSDMTLAYFDHASKQYQKIPLHEQVEVLSLVGDIAMQGDKPKVHAHVVVGLRDGTTRGGHIMDAHVWPTLEVIVVEPPAHLRRVGDPDTGLALIRL